MRKLGYFLPRAIGLFILSFIPVVNIIAAPLWLLWGLMMAIQYIDYPADNHKLGWNEMLAWLRKTLAEHEFRRHCLSGAADSGGQHPDDAGRGGRGDAVLGA
jgi:hypothetical protein